MKYIAIKPIVQNRCDSCCFTTSQWSCSRPHELDRCCEKGLHVRIYIKYIAKLNTNTKVI
jgi:hypothetical protein